MTSDWKPRLRPGLRWESLQLSPEEGFLLSRVDGSTSVDGLRQLTGLSEARVSEVLHKLAHSGAIDPAPARTALHAVVDLTAEDPPAPRARRHEIEDIDDDDDDDLIQRALAEIKMDPSLLGEDTDEGEPVDDPPAPVLRTGRPAPAPIPPVGEAFDKGPELLASDDIDDHVDPQPQDDADDGGADDGGTARDQDNAEQARDEDGVRDGHAGSGDEEKPEEGEAEEAEVEEGNYRKLFETKLHGLPQEEREKLARVENGPTLLALCFDPVPSVIASLMENSEVGFPHARLVARYHRTPQGLEAIFSKRPELARDSQVQRWMLANPMLADTHLKRILQPRPLLQVYRWSLSRDLPEHNRGKVRHMFRNKWGTADGEERANLVWSCEGRCLQFLIGMQLDSKATTLLCARSIHSVMLVQSLCRFTATPPPLLAHLARQPLVKRQPNLRTMIMQHPNCPSDLKRSMRSPG